jgi:hypothetical protein
MRSTPSFGTTTLHIISKNPPRASRVVSFSLN